MKSNHFDFLVVGSGLAGLVAAYHASAHGTVALLSKSDLDVSNSYHAQGGIAAAIGGDDNPALHLEDTLTVGRNLCDRDAAKILVEEGLECVEELIARGMRFDCDEQGELKLGLEGGHSRRRILHADGDATGKMMTSFMLQQVLANRQITPFEYCAALTLFVEGGRCYGLQALEFTTGQNLLFTAKATILATGGLSRLYSRSTNPYTATGDGIALAWQAGAQLADMEFIQFHPTALSLPGEEAFLISEAVRGEGARLIDSTGYRFMPEIHPMAELAPRDVVAAAIFNQTKKTRGPIYLTLAHLDTANLAQRFPSIFESLQRLGLDMRTDKIPVAPAAHYMVGGIRTDLWGQTNIEALFACGEVAATGAMGANRLASNSLLECLVFGKRVITKAIQLTDSPIPDHSFEWIGLNKESDASFLTVKNALAEVMSDTAGIVRNEPGLLDALNQIDRLAQDYPLIRKDYNYHKINQLIQICRAITYSALERKESRGGHIRTDYPHELVQFEHHIIQEQGKAIHFEPVRL